MILSSIQTVIQPRWTKFIYLFTVLLKKSVCFDNCTDYQLPHQGPGSCSVSLPAGRGQSGAPSGAGHSRLALALNAVATPHWRTQFALGGAWINRHSSGYIINNNRSYIQAKTFTLHHRGQIWFEGKKKKKRKVDNKELDLKADRVLTWH